jgi:L-amino acid N-acyltransferase YncA
MDDISIKKVTADNVTDLGIFCSKDKKSPGFKAKLNWFKAKQSHGVTILLAVDPEGKQLGFVEYLPSELAWRPVKADNHLFIHCIMVTAKNNRGKNIASLLVQACENEASWLKMNGVCVMTSSGTWMADKRLFLKNGFEIVDSRGRFELMVKKFDSAAPDPRLPDWSEQQAKYQGWNLLYADQCPWHEKSVTDLQAAAKSLGLDLKVIKLKSPQEAQNSPSGFGVFALVHDGKLLEDHYLSRTRFESIIKKELAIST